MVDSSSSTPDYEDILASHQSKFASALTGLSDRVLSYPLDQTTDVRDWGVVDDPTGAHIASNTEALILAVKSSAGIAKLIIPPNLTLIVTPMVWSGDYADILISGTIKLAPNSASTSSIRANVIDLQMSNFKIEFSNSGSIDGNRSAQSWSSGQVVGGITSNTYSTDGVQLVDSGADASVPVHDGLIINPIIKNVGNWPISLGYCQNIHIVGGRLSNSGNSPQFFAGSTDCSIRHCTMTNITDAGFSLYVGNTRNIVADCLIDSCNQGLGAYVENDSRNAVTDCLITNNIIKNCNNGAIGFTTGGSVTTPKIINCIARGNVCINNGVAANNNSAILGAVGVQDVVYRDNIVIGGCANQTSGTPYGVYVDGSSNGVQITGNTFQSIGNATRKGTGVYINGAKNVLLANNLIRDRNSVMDTAYTGTCDSASICTPNFTQSFTGTVGEVTPSPNKK